MVIRLQRGRLIGIKNSVDERYDFLMNTLVYLEPMKRLLNRCDVMKFSTGCNSTSCRS